VAIVRMAGGEGLSLNEAAGIDAVSQVKGIVGKFEETIDCGPSRRDRGRRGAVRLRPPFGGDELLSWRALGTTLHHLCRSPGKISGWVVRGAAH